MKFDFIKATVLSGALILVSLVSNATEGKTKKKKSTSQPRIEIVNFSGSYNSGNTIDILCEVKSNCCYNIIVERSKNGKKFTSIGSFSDNKNLAEYMMVDNSPNKTNYYRLKIIDNQGNVDYSNLMVTQLYNANEVVSMVNITPVTREKNLQVSLDLKNRAFVIMKVMDDKGNEIFQKRVTGETGENCFDIDGSKDMIPGNYTLEVRVNNTNQLVLPLVKK